MLRAAIAASVLVWIAFSLPQARAAEPPAAQAETAEAPQPVSPAVTEAVVNAPIGEVWEVFSTAEGFKKLGVAKCDFDLRIGGEIRAHYNPAGELGDDGTIVNEILSYEPGRMLSIHIKQPPKTFPFSEQTWKNTWSVITLTDLGESRTHVRLVGYGYTDAPESQAMKTFFENGNRWVMTVLQKSFDADAPAPPASVHSDAPLSPVTHERVVELPRETVWKLLSTAAGWKTFLDVQAKIELRPGGLYEILFKPDAPAGERGAEDCHVLSYVPGEMLSFTWSAPPKYPNARKERTWVVIRLESLTPDRTRVRLDHLGFAEQASTHPDDRAQWEGTREYFQRAWGNVLDALREQGAPRTAKAITTN